MSFNYDQLTRWDAVKQFLFLLTWHLCPTPWVPFPPVVFGVVASVVNLRKIFVLFLSVCLSLLWLKLNDELSCGWRCGHGENGKGVWIECLILIKFSFPQSAAQAAEAFLANLIVLSSCGINGLYSASVRHLSFRFRVSLNQGSTRVIKSCWSWLNCNLLVN